MIVGCWNAAWHKSASWQADAIRRRLLDQSAELICSPESYTDFLADEGWHGIFSRPDYGYALVAGRRKVALWSRAPWREVDDLGAHELPGGRFVQGVTETRGGPVRVVGVCIPWSAAHVSTGRRDRIRWEDHRAYVRVLTTVLERLPDDVPTIVVGDFNQRIPRKRSPSDLHEALMAALSGYDVWTAGNVSGLVDSPVCHIAGSRHFRLVGATGHGRETDRGALSDHDGLTVEVALA